MIVSADENFEEAAQYQAAEEIGIVVVEVHYLGFVDYPKHRLYCFSGRAPQKAIPQRLHLEVNALQFYPLTKALDLVDNRQQQLLNSLNTTLDLLREIA